jgi:hypothetical protein
MGALLSSRFSIPDAVPQFIWLDFDLRYLSKGISK